MPLPKYDEILLPALELLNDGIERRIKEFEAPLATRFKLTDDEINKMYKSGNGPIFKDRIQWALSYLNMAGLVQKPKRGVYQINTEGQKRVIDKEGLKQYVRKKVFGKETIKNGKKLESTSEDDIPLRVTPEESLFESYQGIKESIYREILDTILTKTPREFEKLVVQLLQKMGYGGEIEDAGIVTQYSNDQGIDGIVKEDILGFGRIHIQAKRYGIGKKISREDIQKFVGALAVAKSDKGVFITTSDFTKNAKEYADSLNSSAKIVLINGTKLASYIYEYDLGMQTERTIVIKKLDTDFWDELTDDKS